MDPLYIFMAGIFLVISLSGIIGYMLGLRARRRSHDPAEWLVRPAKAEKTEVSATDGTTYPKVFWARHDHHPGDTDWS